MEALNEEALRVAIMESEAVVEAEGHVKTWSCALVDRAKAHPFDDKAVLEMASSLYRAENARCRAIADAVRVTVLMPR